MGFYVGRNYFSYNNFYEFQCLLAKEIGIDFKNTTGEISTYDNIKYLLNFDESEGYITAYQCELIAPRLISLTDRWEKSWNRKLKCYREKAIIMAEDMKNCSESNDRLMFE